MHRQQGQSLTELIVVLFIISTTLLATMSAAGTARKRIALTAATSELRAVFLNVRALAVAHDRNTAIRFRQEGQTWSWTIYEDGDGDGVRNDDITRHTDFPIGRTRVFQHPPVRIGVPSGPVIDPTTGQLLSLRLPVRFGTSMLCSFSREGEATNGSVVLTDGRNTTIIRISGRSALVNVMKWDGRKWVTGV
jgi:type II secretory pathway pseudopilin PulG